MKIRNENLVLLIVILLSFFSLGAAYSIVFYNNVNFGFYFLVAVNLIAIVLLIYFARKKDKRED